MEGLTILKDGLKNWKLRLILSAVLCIMGLAGLISMLLGIFVELSVSDKSIVAIAIWMIGVPAYLIVSKIATITPQSVAQFINQNSEEVKEDLQILLKNAAELDEEARIQQQKLIQFFSETPVYKLLPDKPVKQAYFLMLISMVLSFGIWFIF